MYGELNEEFGQNEACLKTAVSEEPVADLILASFVA
jgi:hypothetical protein